MKPKRYTQADVVKLEAQLTEDKINAAQKRQTAHDAERDAKDAEQQVFETRAALIRAINAVQTTR